MFMQAADQSKASTKAQPRQPSNTNRARKRLEVLPPPDPVEELETLGEALHGAHWMGPTARDLNIAHTTLAKWVSGKSRFRDGPVLDALRLLVKQHHAAVAKARLVAKGNVKGK